MGIKDNIERLSLEKLVPYIGNPVKHPTVDIDRMASILKEFGCRPPILIKKGGEIVDGHLRYEAAILLKWTELPVIICDDWTNAQIKAYRLTSRNSASWANWDDALLRIELSQIKTLDFNIDLLGFEQSELDNLRGFNDKPDSDNSGPDDSAPKKIIIKEGDLFRLGKHRILCGDSTSEENIRLLMDGKKASMVFEDTPYNLSVDTIGINSMPSKIKKHGNFKMVAGELNGEQFTEFLKDIFKLNAKYSKNGSIHFICMDWRHMSNILTAGKLYTEFKQLCVWVKDNAGMGTFYRSKHELIFIFKNGKAKHTNNFKLGEGGRYRTNVWEYPTSSSFVNQARIKTEDGREVAAGGTDLEGHPTPKPLQLVADACLDCSKEGDIILDLFLGGGTTLIAAEQTKRTCYGMELDTKYVESTICRFAKKFDKEVIDFEHINGGDEKLTLQQIMNNPLKL